MKKPLANIPKNKTIIFSANTSWYLKNFRATTINRFIAEDFHVVCICPKDRFTKDLIEMGCEFIDLEMNNKGLNPIQDLRLIYTFYKLYKSINPHAVFNFTIKNNIYGAYAGSMTGSRVFSHITGLGTAVIHGGILSYFVKFLYATSQIFATSVFCQNRDDHYFFIKNHLVAKNKLQIIPGSGINLEKFSYPERYAHPKDPDDLMIFLYAGRILKDKGLFELVEAIKLVNKDMIKCKLKIYGFLDVQNISSIPESTVLLWRDIPGIEWCGESKDMFKIMKRIDCVILPSYREGMPRTLLEAAASSLPIIATDVPGCREIVENNINGFLCKPRDVESLKQSILKMMYLTIEERIKMGHSGRKIALEKFDEEIVVNVALDAVR
jgi:glycosyltransferase involved in cell wall biosynthesis